MGITDFFAELYDSVSSSFTTEAHAEEPQKDNSEDSGDSEEGGDDKEGGDEGRESEGDEEGGEEGGDEEGGEEEEEEEEGEEPEDPKPRLEEECARSAQCIGYKHHFDECVGRVTAHHEDPEYKGPKEDCVEEFFHLQHCATQCAAPKLFKQLK